jgi:hypothetical protein
MKLYLLLSSAVTVSLLTSPFAFAAEPTYDDEYLADQRSCLSTLNIPASLLTKTSFKLRVEKCIQNLKASREAQSRTSRSRTRVQVRQENSQTTRSFLWERFSEQRKFERTASDLQQKKVLDVTRLKTDTTGSPVVRPSTRVLRKEIHDRKIDSTVTSQKRRAEALAACEHIVKSFDRNNCVREKFRDLGGGN